MKVDIKLKFDLPRPANYICSSTAQRESVPIDIGELDEDSMKQLADTIRSNYIEHWKKRKAMLSKQQQ